MNLFNLLRLTVPLWKYLDPVVNIVIAQETGSILKIDFSSKNDQIHIRFTRKYSLCEYILGVPTHATAWDQQWRGDETLK